MQSSPLTPIELLLHAGLVVKSVLALLALMSVWSWAIIVRCFVGLLRLRHTTRTINAVALSTTASAILASGRREARTSIDRDSIGEHRDRVVASMRRRVQEFVETSQAGLGSLAVISSVAPFIGLFGTVWGIMESFIGIAAAKDTSLAVVAPGIAEALAATAVGLVVAIPAAFAYNRFAAAFSLASRRLVRGIEDRVTDLLYVEPSGANR